MIKKFNEFNQWVSTTTTGQDYNMDYITDDKIFYGIHKVTVVRDGKSIEVKAKFDTGARSSSIDFSVAKKLGISERLIRKCKELDSVDIDKNISKKEQDRIEKEYTKKLKSEYPEVTSVQMSKSSSGFSVRAYIKVTIQYYGNSITTEANLRDRTGLSCEVLVGLKDMVK